MDYEQIENQIINLENIKYLIMTEQEKSEQELLQSYSDFSTWFKIYN